MSIANKSEVWSNFKKVAEDRARCNHCNKMLSCKGSSTSNLHHHLKAIHNIITDKKTETTDKQETPGPSCLQKQISISNFIKRSSLEEIVSKLAAFDGFSINSITTSSFIRESIQQRGYSLPKNNSRVMDLIYTYYDKAKSETINELDRIKKDGKCFSITLDEWTSKRNRRYLNINVHRNAEEFNLGLVPIVGSCDAKRILELVSTRLQIFNLDLTTNIIAATNDGAAVMKKFGQLSIIINQLCYSHAIHLAVTDVLYKNENITETDVCVTSEESEDDLECDDNYEDDFSNYFELLDKSNEFPIVSENYKSSISQIRRICKFFRKSPVRNSILQNYVKQKKGKEISLILDCQTRWNSLEIMIERFITLKECILLTLNDIGASHMWNELHYSNIMELCKALGPVRLAAEALGQRDANLLKSEGIFDFLSNELSNLKSEISSKLLNAIKRRVQERRDIALVTLLLYLQNPKNISSKNFTLFSLASKSEIIKLSEKILFRIYPNLQIQMDLGDECIEVDRSVNLNKTMEESINKFLEEPQEITSNLKTLKAEFSIYESTNKRTKNLDLLFDALKTICPTSVPSERVFSISGNFVTKIRSSLSDRSVDALCFLKTYFLKNETK